jgi:hypothetical protein
MELVPLMQHLLLISSLMLVIVRLLVVAASVVRQKERWTQFIFPSVVGIELGRVFLGDAHRTSMLVILGGLELTILALVGFSFRRLGGEKDRFSEERFYRRLRDFFPPHLALLTAQEVLTIASSAFLFSAAQLRVGDDRAFSYTDNSPIKFLPLILLVAGIPEGLFLHFALASHPYIADAAWVFYAWAIVWSIGLYVSMRRRPHILGESSLLVRMGIRKWCSVPLESVSGTRTIPTDKLVRGLEPGANFTLKHCVRMELTLSEPVRIHHLGGRVEEVQRLLVTVDDIDGLRRKLTQRVLSASV